MKNITDFMNEPVTEGRIRPDKEMKSESEALAELKERIENANWDNELYWVVFNWITKQKEDIAGNNSAWVIKDSSGAWVQSWGTEDNIIKSVAEKLKSAKLR